MDARRDVAACGTWYRAFGSDKSFVHKMPAYSGSVRHWSGDNRNFRPRIANARTKEGRVGKDAQMERSVIYSVDDFLDRNEKTYDVCVIGSGPSGMCFGLELLYSGLTVCTVAGGDLNENSYYRQLKSVECPELEIKDDSRIRAFGGSSTVWSGFIAPLDAIDLNPRCAMHPGWPREANVDAVINERGHRYNLPQLSLFDADSLCLDPWPKFAQLAKKIFFVQRPPLNFARQFKYAFARSGFDLVLGAVATGLDTENNGDGRSATFATLRSSAGRTGKVAARVFILAAGCIENVRLLWNSKDETGVALGNNHDQLGRRFMNHPKGYVGEVCFDRPLDLRHPVFRLNRGYFRGYVGFRLKDSPQDGILNCCLRLEPLYATRNLRAAVKSAIRLHPRQAIRSGLLALKDLWELTRAFKLPLRWGTVANARVRCFLEMEPSPTNRITLSERSDPLGVAIPIVKYSVSERALKSVTALITRFSCELNTLGIGKFTPYASPLSASLTWDAAHHLGGTSMGPDPRTSVVNHELRLHGVDNVYLAGGSTFPTGGNANPTLTMIGLSLRLADTVRATLSPPKLKVTTIPRPATISARSHGMIIVGSGRRVAEDVVPAVEALGELAHIQSIYATRPGVVFGRQRPYEVRPIDELPEEEITSAGAIYIAVPPDQVPTVLAALRQYDCRHVKLIVDTPAVSSKTLDADYDRFRSVQVAEDSVALPWLPAVQACLGAMSEPREIQFLNSAYRYHAIALAKAVTRQFKSQGGVKSAYRIRRRTRLRLTAGSSVLLEEPRDYEAGRLNIAMKNGRIISSHPGADITIKAIRHDDHCIGFTVADSKAYLNDVETNLVGRFIASDNVVTKMPDFKRVGLYRMLSVMLSNEENYYSLEEGVEDAKVNAALQRFHLYHNCLGN